jgi:hypothetical protein
MPALNRTQIPHLSERRNYPICHRTISSNILDIFAEYVRWLTWQAHVCKGGLLIMPCRVTRRKALLRFLSGAGLLALLLAASMHPPPVFGAAITVESRPPCTTGNPCVVFDSVPDYGVWGGILKGHVENLPDPGKYLLYLYIQVAGGWWSKPTFAFPYFQVASDGKFAGSFTTGGSDHKAALILGVLVRADDTPPPARGGEASLPAGLDQYPQALADRSAALPGVSFAGYVFQAKDIFWGPGPCYFAPENVRVDAQGHLHLQVVKRGTTWTTAEVVLQTPLGEGTYTWVLSSPVDRIDKNLVLGLFLFDLAAPQEAYREVDFEFSRWMEETPLNAQFVVQPPEGFRRHRFAVSLASPGGDSSAELVWRSGGIRFRLLEGDQLEQRTNVVLHEWEFPPVGVTPAPSVPAATGQVRMNFWQAGGYTVPPSDGKDAEVVIKRFVFTP